MAEIKKYPPGTFCWTELATLDSKPGKKFYQDLFGWSVKDVPIEEGMNYTIFYIDGKDVCALYPMDKEQKNQKTTPHWMPYISVADVDNTVEKAQSGKGEIITQPMDVMDIGRMATIMDPTGAVFSVWQPKKHIGARIYDHSGTVCWRELQTKNVDVAGKFYNHVFNWEISSEKMEKFTYYSFKNKNEGVGGMMEAPKKVGPHWLTYWSVDNCDQSTSRAKFLGGTVINPPTDIPEVGRFAIVTDPQGACFAVIQVEI